MLAPLPIILGSMIAGRSINRAYAAFVTCGLTLRCANYIETSCIYPSARKAEDGLKFEPIEPDPGCTRYFAERAEVTLLCEVRQGVTPWQMVRLNDISQSGFRIALLPGARVNVPLRIRIPGLRMLTAQVRWIEGKTVGCEFAEPLHVAVFEHIVAQCGAASSSPA